MRADPDGGKTWQFVAWIGPEPEGFAIMPSTVRLGDRELLTAIRRHEGPKNGSTLTGRSTTARAGLDMVPARTPARATRRA